MASRAWPKNSKQTVRICFGMRCKIQVALVIRPSQPSFWIPGKPDKNLSVTSLPKPAFLNLAPSISKTSERKTLAWGTALPSDQIKRNRAMPWSWILPRLWSSRSMSNQFPSGSTMRQLARLSSAVPHKTAFLPPAFMAIFPPMQLASAEVGSTAKTSPCFSAASATRRVTTPAPEKIVGTGALRPGNAECTTTPRSINFSVLITADIATIGMAPPVYPVPPPRGTIVSPSSMQALTKFGISASVSGLRTTNGYSIRQSVASVTCATRDIPSNAILSTWVNLLNTLLACLRNCETVWKLFAKDSTAVRAANINSLTCSAKSPEIRFSTSPKRCHKAWMSASRRLGLSNKSSCK